MNFFQTIMLAVKKMLFSWIAADVVESYRSKKTSLAACTEIIKKREIQLSRLTKEGAPQVILKRIRDDIRIFKKKRKELSNKV